MMPAGLPRSGVHSRSVLRVLLRVVLATAGAWVVCGCGNDSGDADSLSGGAGGAGTGGTDGGGSGAAPIGGSAGGVTSGAWSMGYYASWAASQYPIDEIEWSGLTHLAVAFYMPQSDGSLNLLSGDDAYAADLVAAVHDHGVLAVASIGGADSGDAFRQATASGTLDGFVDSLVALLDAGYDGIDIDWEPLETTDEATAITLADAVKAARPSALMTIPIGYVNPNLDTDISGYAAIADAYDQLNIMSYGMAGAWPGWNSWHSSALYQTNSATPLSIDGSVGLYIEAGVPVDKLGIGIGFYGLCYSEPVTGPDQALDGATILASDGTMSYANIMGSYYEAGVRQWDATARVPYLSFSSPQAPDGCTYISYDDEQSIQEKADYLRSQGLGGVIQWEINEGYLASAPAGQRSPLLLAVRDYVLD